METAVVTVDVVADVAVAAVAESLKYAHTVFKREMLPEIDNWYRRRNGSPSPSSAVS